MGWLYFKIIENDLKQQTIIKNSKIKRKARPKPNCKLGNYYFFFFFFIFKTLNRGLKTS